MSQKKRERIISDPLIQNGKAIIKGTRIAVNFLVELLRNNWSRKQILENYPVLEIEDILATINYKINQYSELVNKTLTKWNEKDIEEFLRKAKDGSLVNAENDAISLKQGIKEKQFLIKKKNEIE
ncbi:MAG: DUF433 domain-containing protein [Candidatus Heimdallarchaeota archaeon]|nr:MAG: DUF433 domain-containing protein [Candidatus Heimdallarchaeota archaeon]